jgi:hypothetical protein
MCCGPHPFSIMFQHVHIEHPHVPNGVSNMFSIQSVLSSSLKIFNNNSPSFCCLFPMMFPLVASLF